MPGVMEMMRGGYGNGCRNGGKGEEGECRVVIYVDMFVEVTHILCY
jgi:hypothetical protein